MVSKAINEGLIERIQRYVANDINSKIIIEGEFAEFRVDPSEVHVSSFYRILGNWRATATAERKGSGYYELIHDGTSNTTLVNIYIAHTSSPQQAII